MNNRLVLINSLTLLFRESQIPGGHEKSSELIRSVLGTVKVDTGGLTLNPETRIIDDLRKMVLVMCDDPNDHEYEVLELLQRIKIIFGEDELGYETVKEGLTTELSERSLKRTCINIRRNLQNHYRELNIEKILGKAAGMVRFKREEIRDMKQFVAQLCAELEPYQQDIVTKDPAIVGEIHFDNEESIREVFEDVKKDVDGTGILRTGWQGINRMIRGGFRRGESTVIGALQHNFKTGFVLNIFRHIAQYNAPEMIDPLKRPMIILFSFENELNTNLHLLYKYTKENETGVEVTEAEVKTADTQEMASYISKALGRNGYFSRMIRIDPSRWSYMDICNKILELEAEGFEIHATVIDYLSMVPTTGCKQGATGDDIRDLYRRMRNFTSARKIALITPHQLSSEAKQLTRDGRNDFVKEIANKGYYDGCKRLDQEVDLEIYIHIEKVNGVSYLTVQRGKHRSVVGQTPLEDMYCVLQFEKVCAIPDDVNGPDRTRRKVGGGLVGSGQENPWWDDVAA